MVRPTTAFRAMLVCLAYVPAAACGSSPSVPGGPPFVMSTRPVAESPASRNFHHLYAAQGFYGTSAVLRYPLRADGLPGKNPDGKLNLDFPFPGSIAIGPNDGDLYVSSSGGTNGCEKKKCFVAVFAPGASDNAKPVRILYVPQTPVFLAVDQRGYLDVSTHPGWQRPVTNVYNPGAKGNDQSINQISTAGNNALGASHGIVYIQTLPLGMGIEAAGERSSTQQPVFYTYGYNFSADGITTDGNHMYAQFFWPDGSLYQLATAVYRIGQPGAPIRTIVGTGCTVSSNGGALGYGLAIFKKYIFEGCLDTGGSAGSVLVYDSTKSGMQAPITQVPGGDTGVAIGP